ncbi:hypothetical protein OG195_14755 [Streptomyces sp. NBC_01362]|uniref:hypothetical protein n=1 Tax=Streptomyces sp. NBC_01362 TaxID=2903839 RepID=UPI002E32D85F|nr:hypothetical protein [Streptomyces sp. NBC_01362]
MSAGTGWAWVRGLWVWGGAVRAWCCSRLPLGADRSPAYAPSGSRDPAPDESRDVVDSRLEESMRVFAGRHIRRWAAAAAKQRGA